MALLAHTQDRVVAGVNDGMLVARVSAALAHDSEFGERPIEVQAHGGWVTLDGTVSSEKARRRAEAIATEVQGVSHVENHLRD